jgi:hypothetical protein
LDPAFLFVVTIADDAKLRIWDPHKSAKRLDWTSRVIDDCVTGDADAEDRVTDASPEVVVDLKVSTQKQQYKIRTIIMDNNLVHILPYIFYRTYLNIY